MGFECGKKRSRREKITADLKDKLEIIGMVIIISALLFSTCWLATSVRLTETDGMIEGEDIQLAEISDWQSDELDWEEPETSLNWAENGEMHKMILPWNMFGDGFSESELPIGSLWIIVHGTEHKELRRF